MIFPRTFPASVARNLYFVGTAGSGKTTLVHAFATWMSSQGLDTVSVNLDPGVDQLPYQPDVDIRDWISVPEIMKERGLGPNGAQIAAADMLALNAGEVAEVIDRFETPYILLDTPGQLELFAFREASKVIIDAFGREQSALVFLTDPAMARRASGFVSATLLAVTTQFRHSLPFIHLLSKADLLPEPELERVVKWSLDAMSLYQALTEDEASPKTVLDLGFFQAMEDMGVYKRLSPVSSELMFGFEEIYGIVQQVFEGGEDLRPD